MPRNTASRPQKTQSQGSPGAGKTRFHFTKRLIEAIRPPASGRSTYHDAKTPGLILRVTPTGAKSFAYYRRVNGRPIRLTLGSFPAVSVEQAQNLCKKHSGTVANGGDPMATKLAARAEPTMADLFAHWMIHAKARKKTWAEDQRQIDTMLKRMAPRPLSMIRKIEIAQKHAAIGEKHGRYAANRVLALLRAMFNMAGDIGFVGENPAKGIKRFPEEKRDRFLHGDELRDFFTALAEEPSLLMRDFFFVALLTGARRANVQAMAWADVDFSLGLWRIPDTKSGQPIVVPLVGPVLAILQARHEGRGSAKWVFPSYGQSGHLVEPKASWKRLMTRAGLQDVRPHDLRRSIGSWMAIGGSGLPIIGKMLGHTQQSTTQIYARLSVEPVRLAAESATAAMLAAGNYIDTTSQEGGGE